MLEKIWSLIDDAHERAALGLFASAWFLRLYAGFDDWATVAMFGLAAVTLVGQQRYAGLSVGPQGFSVASIEAETTVVVKSDNPLQNETAE